MREAVHAAVVVKSGTEAPAPGVILEWCRVRLASAKVPQRIEYVAALPRTASGKLLHRPTTGAGGTT